MIHIHISDRTYGELVGARAVLFVAVYGNGKRSQLVRLKKIDIQVEGEVVKMKIKHWNGTSYGDPMYYPVIHLKPSIPTWLPRLRVVQQ